MSDFLSKFNKDKYQDLLEEQQQDANKNAGKTQAGPDKETTDQGLNSDRNQQAKDQGSKTDTNKQAKDQGSKADTNQQTTQKEQQKQGGAASVANTKKSIPDLPSTPDPFASRSRYWDTEDVEIDPDYQRKRILRIGMISAGIVLASLLVFFIYHMLVHVKVDDFIGQPVSEARAWAKDHDVEVELIQEHSMEYDANQIISQSVQAGDKIRKGKTLELTSSLGPDPDETLPLPDFSEMNQWEAESWKEENKAENLQIVMEYHDEIEEGQFIKLTIRDSGIDEETYKRRDSAAVYYSRGKEVFEKNITVPDFTGKAVEEVEQWATTNEIEMTYKESDSDQVEAGFIISQSIAADEKVAKRDEMEVVVSVGKATIVPDFAELTAEEAMTEYPELDIAVKQVYHAEVAYGRLISQSVEAGTKMTDQDDKRITVTYSLGKPFLQDFRGHLEGELPRLFFDEYQSKGADIKYIVKYVSAPEIKGTVVHMSKFNEFVPMKYTVEIHVSNNTSVPPGPPSFPDPEPIPPDLGEVDEEIEEDFDDVIEK